MAIDANLGTLRSMCQRIAAIISNSRGAAAVEFAIAFPLLVTLLLPITDIAMVAFRYVSAYQAMRSLGAYALYHPPSDVTDSTSWAAGLATKIPGYTINTEVRCGSTDAICTSDTAQPRWFWFRIDITVTPLIPAWGICATPCILTHTERFP